MRLIIALLIQAVSGVLSGPDPAQMEKAPDLGYRAVPAGLSVPEGMKMGASSSVAIDSRGHLVVFNRGDHPLMEFDPSGALVRAFGEGQYIRPHGMRIDPEGNIWTTDVAAHTVTKLGPKGDVLMVLGTKGQAGAWDEAGQSRLLTEPTDIGFGPQGDVFVGGGTRQGRAARAQVRQARQAAEVVGRIGKRTRPVRPRSLGRNRCEGTCVMSPTARTAASRCSTSTAGSSRNGDTPACHAVCTWAPTSRCIWLGVCRPDSEARQEWQGHRGDGSAR